MFFLDALSSKEEEPILILDDSTKIFEIEDYSLFLEDTYILWIIYLFILFIFLNILLYIHNILYVFLLRDDSEQFLCGILPFARKQQCYSIKKYNIIMIENNITEGIL